MTKSKEKVKVNIPQSKQGKFKQIYSILKSICPKMLNCDVQTILIKFVQDESYNDICYDRLIFSKEKKLKKIDVNKALKSFSPEIIDNFNDISENYSEEDKKLIKYTLSLDIQSIAQEFADNNKISNCDYIKITKEHIEFFMKDKVFTL